MKIMDQIYVGKNEVYWEGLNYFQRVCQPSPWVLQKVEGDPKTDQEKQEQKIDWPIFEALSEVLKCAICLDIMRDPTNVKLCLHKFCAPCIEKYIW